MDKYEQLNVVGEGSYGLVIKCRHKETDQIVAVKKFLETEEDSTIRKMALREIRMLKKLKHENLVALIEVFRQRKRFYLVFEYLEGTILNELEKMPGGLGDDRSRERIFQVIRAINYCHYNHIIHRDVKPENVLVSSLGVVKLCDFGFARFIGQNGEPCTEYVATRWYRAPELLVGEPIYGAPVDIWAIGCLFAEMMTGDPIFPGDSDIDQLYLVVKMLGKPCLRHQQLMSKNSQLRTAIKTPNAVESSSLYKAFPSWSLQSLDFLVSCMRMDPQQRMTSDELLKHAYFTHDRFPQRFLPALREKVNMEFNNPLLRRLKTEILMSTDKKDESKCRRSSHTIENGVRQRIVMHTEGSMKRKLSCDTSNISATNDTINTDKNLITLAKTSQKLNIIQKNQSILQKQQSLLKPAKPALNNTTTKVQSNNSGVVGNPVVMSSINLEMHMLEKSLESLVKVNKYDRPKTSQKADSRISPLLPESPQPFQSLHYGGFGDSKSPIINVLHPCINNIHFNNKDHLKKSPNVLHSFNQGSKVPGMSFQHQSQQTHRNHFLKKLDRNIVMENLFANGDQGMNFTIKSNSNNTPIWLNSTNIYRKKDQGNNTRMKNDDFFLPNLPGATGSPNKTKKKTTDIESFPSNEVSPAYRYQKAKRKLNTLDITLPFPVVKEKYRF